VGRFAVGENKRFFRARREGGSMSRLIAKISAISGFLATMLVATTIDAAGRNRTSKLERRASILIRKQAFAKAVVLYEDVAVRKPHVAARVLGPLYAALGWNDRSFQFYSKMVERFPQRAWYWYCLGYAARALKRWPRAIRAYRYVVRLAPRDPSAWYGLALSLLGAGRRKEASQAVEKYVSSEKRAWAKPWVAKAKRLLADIGGNFRTRPASSGRPAVRVAPRKTGHRLGAWADRTKALVAVAAVVRATERGRLDEAEKLGWQALRRYPRFGKVYLALSMVMEKRHDWRRAMGILRLGLRRIDSFPAGRVGLARIAWDHGLRDEAMLNLAAFAREPSHDVLVLDEAAKLAGALGRTDWQRRFLSLKAEQGHPKKRAGAQGRVKTLPGRIGGAPKAQLAVFVAEAKRMMAQGRCRDAVRRIEPAVLSHPHQYELLVLSAEALLCARGDMHRALRRSLAASRIAPDRFSAWRTAGLAALRLRGRKAARTYLARYVELAQNVASERSKVAFVKALLQNLRESP